MVDCEWNSQKQMLKTKNKNDDIPALNKITEQLCAVVSLSLPIFAFKVKLFFLTIISS